MKENLQKLKYTIHFVKQKAIENKSTAIFFVSFVIIILVLILLKGNPNYYTNKDLGYQITGPAKWHKQVSDDKTEVTFKKYEKESFENAHIKLDVEWGNPYGNTALDYIQNGLLKQIKYTYEELQQSNVNFREDPNIDIRRGMTWARVSFFIDYNELQVLYVTQANENVFILVLNTTGTHQREDERQFKRTVESFRVRDIYRKKHFQ